MNPYAATPGGYREANLCAQDFRIDNNIAQEGAAIYGDVDTDFLGESMPSRVLFNRSSEWNLVCMNPEPVESLGAVACAADVPCNELAYNVAEDSGGNLTGAVILMQTNGEFSGIRFRMHHNIAAHLIRSVSDDFGNDIEMSRCLFTDNALAGSAVLQSPDDGSVHIDECTFARNTFASGGAVEVHGSTPTTITRSLFDQPGLPIVFDTDLAHVSAHLVVSSDLSSLPAASDNLQATPLFINPDGGDYHLQRNSPGIDFASDGGHFIDLDANPRTVNLARPNVHGAQDVGALETQFTCFISDSVFCDSFDPEPVD
jgi:hypothetical protein